MTKNIKGGEGQDVGGVRCHSLTIYLTAITLIVTTGGSGDYITGLWLFLRLFSLFAHSTMSQLKIFIIILPFLVAVSAGKFTLLLCAVVSFFPSVRRGRLVI